MTYTYHGTQRLDPEPRDIQRETRTADAILDAESAALGEPATDDTVGGEL